MLVMLQGARERGAHRPARIEARAWHVNQFIPREDAGSARRIAGCCLGAVKKNTEIAPADPASSRGINC
jgi:hypothetical protein